MRKLLMAVVCAALLSALCPGLGRAGMIEQGLYDLYYEGVVYAEIHEKVFDQESTFDLTGISNAYLYSYTVINDTFTNPGIWTWGFMQHPSTWGATVLATYSPTGWWGFVDCAHLAGQQAAWAGNAAPNPGAGPDVLQDWIPQAQSLDTFFLVAREGPYRMVDAFAHDGTPVFGADIPNAVYAYGQISGPTPEPVTLGLLALGLPLGLLARRRKKD